MDANVEGDPTSGKNHTSMEWGDKTRVVIHELYPSKESLDAAIASGAKGWPSEMFEQLDEPLFAGADERS